MNYQKMMARTNLSICIHANCVPNFVARAPSIREMQKESRKMRDRTQIPHNGGYEKTHGQGWLVGQKKMSQNGPRMTGHGVTTRNLQLWKNNCLAAYVVILRCPKYEI